MRPDPVQYLEQLKLPLLHLVYLQPRSPGLQTKRGREHHSSAFHQYGVRALSQLLYLPVRVNEPPSALFQCAQFGLEFLPGLC